MPNPPKPHVGRCAIRKTNRPDALILARVARSRLLLATYPTNLAPMPPDLPQTEVAVIELTNVFRKASALQEVRPNPALTAAARAFARHMARTGKFGHDADGREPHQRAEAEGYEYCLVAENLAWNADSRGYRTHQLAGEILQGWKESPGHRENLLLPGATEIGVAIAQAPGNVPKFIAVQLLGRPNALKVRFTIRNASGAPVRYSLGVDTETLEPAAAVTYEVCDAPQLTFEGTGQAPARFDPRNGDRFVIRAAADRRIKIEISPK